MNSPTKPIRRRALPRMAALALTSAVAVAAHAQSAPGIETNQPRPIAADIAPLFAEGDLPERITVRIERRDPVVLEPRRRHDHPSVNACATTGVADGTGSFVLARGAEGVEGALFLEDGVWTVRTVPGSGPDGPMIAIAADHHNDPGCDGALRPLQPLAGEERPSGIGVEPARTDAGARGSDDPLHTRVLITYDFFATLSVSDMDAFAAAIVESANMSYANSNINTVRLELAGVHEIDPISSSDSAVILAQLTNRSDFVHDEAHTLRDALDADLVAHITDISGICGRAWLAPDHPAYAFSLTDVDCALTNLSFAHEIGHNQGCAHVPDNAGFGYTSYGYGHRWSNDQFRSIMAYAPGLRVMHFSNPDVLHNGEPTGIEGERDNARLIQLTSTQIANHRQGDGSGTDCDADGTPDRYQIALDPSLDRDENRQIDACEIEADPSLDCNNDGVIDTAQTHAPYRYILGITEVFTGGAPIVFTPSGSGTLPDPSGPVTFTVNTSGDFGSTSELLNVSINDGAVVFDAFIDTPGDCYAPGSSASITVSAEEFNTLNAQGLVVTLTPSADVDSSACTAPHLNVIVSYPVSQQSVDANNDGVIDACFCPGDFNADGTLNFFDVSAFIEAYMDQSPTADLNHDGALDFFDVSMFLSLYNMGCP